jgi:hypothetical protein
MDTSAQEKHYLPKEPMDLPRPKEELPAHASYEESSQHDVKTLISWHASGRPFRKRNREYFINVLLIMLATEVILFLFSQYFLMLLVLALVFVNYALKYVPPQNFHYRISTEGIMVEDHFYLWQELYDFYFKREDGVDVLIISTKDFIPGEIVITLGDIHKDHIKSVLLSYLPYREYVKPTFIEKAGSWLARTFPLEKSPRESRPFS